MAALSERQIKVVRNLVEAAPDRVVGSLRQALASTPADSALGGVKRLVDVEVADRNLRNAILQPVAPMFVGGGDDERRLTFPSRALALIWRALKATEGATVEKLRTAHDDLLPAQKVVEAQDLLLAAAAAALRERADDDFRTAAELCDQGREDGADLLTGCLDIGWVVRKAIQRLPEWIAHAGSDTTASSRLSYKDAVAVAEDAGPLFFHMLAAQMAQPWMVLRVVSAVMDKPTERYLRDSELAGFGENLLADIDASLATIVALKAEDGAAAGRSAARLAELVVQQIMEIETCVELPRDQGWGQRVVKQRASLASAVEGRLREAEKAGIDALPMYAPRNQRVRHQVPRLTEPPEERLVVRAMTLLSFSDELHSTANYGGFSTTRNKLIEKLGEYIDHYVDSVIDLLRTDEVDDREVAAAFLSHAADFSQLIRGEKAGELVRRRSQGALHPEQAHQV